MAMRSFVRILRLLIILTLTVMLLLGLYEYRHDHDDVYMAHGTTVESSHPVRTTLTKPNVSAMV